MEIIKISVLCQVAYTKQQKDKVTYSRNKADETTLRHDFNVAVLAQLKPQQLLFFSI